MGVIFLILLVVGLYLGAFLTYVCNRWFRNQQESGSAVYKFLFYGCSLFGLAAMFASMVYISPSGGGAPSNDDYENAALVFAMFGLSPGVSFSGGAFVVYLVKKTR